MQFPKKIWDYVIGWFISSFQDHQNGGSISFSETDTEEQNSNSAYHIHIIILKTAAILMTHL